MAYILRSIAIIGAIVLNSPVHGGKSETAEAPAQTRELARKPGLTAAKEAVGTAIHGVTAAREAAQIMAGLDPEIRDRLLGLAASGLKAQAEAGKTAALR